MGLPKGVKNGCHSEVAVRRFHRLLSTPNSLSSRHNNQPNSIVVVYAWSGILVARVSVFVVHALELDYEYSWIARVSFALYIIVDLCRVTHFDLGGVEL